MDRILSIVWFSGLVLNCLVLVRFVQIGLYRRYPALATFLLFDLLVDGVGMVVQTHLQLSYWMYIATRLPYVALNFLMVPEIFAEPCEANPGLICLGRRNLQRTFWIAGLCAVLLIPATRAQWQNHHFFCWQFVYIEVCRFFQSCLVIFVLLALWELRRSARELPIILPGNTIVYAIGFAAYFSTVSVVGVAALLDQDWFTTQICSLIQQIVYAGCAGMWLLCLRRPKMSALVKQSIPDRELVNALSEMTNVIREIALTTKLRSSNSLISSIFRPAYGGADRHTQNVTRRGEA